MVAEIPATVPVMEPVLQAMVQPVPERPEGSGVVTPGTRSVRLAPAAKLRLFPWVVSGPVRPCRPAKG